MTLDEMTMDEMTVDKMPLKLTVSEMSVEMNFF